MVSIEVDVEHDKTIDDYALFRDWARFSLRSVSLRFILQ